MIKNGICLGGASKQNVFFSKKCAPKNAPMSSVSRIGPTYIIYKRTNQNKPENRPEGLSQYVYKNFCYCVARHLL